MPLYNASSRARNATSLANQNSGGGNKKAGLWSTTGVDSWTNVAHGSKPGKCMTLACMNTNRGRVACAARPVGSSGNGSTYWKC